MDIYLFLIAALAVIVVGVTVVVDRVLARRESKRVVQSYRPRPRIEWRNVTPDVAPKVLTWDNVYCDSGDNLHWRNES